MLLLVDPRRLLRALVLVIALVAGTSLAVNLVALSSPGGGDLEPGSASHWVGLLSVDAEANVPTWLSTALLLTAGLALWGAGVVARRSGDRWHRHWTFLAVVFCYLSLDELAQIHERLSRIVARVLPTHGFLAFGWVLVAAPLVAALGLAYLRFLAALWHPVGRLFVLAGAVYVGGALGVEMLSGWIYDGVGEVTVGYVLASTAEELMEMLGVALFLYAVTSHLRREVGPVQEPAREGLTPENASAVEVGL